MKHARIPKVTNEESLRLTLESAKQLALDIDSPVSLSIYLLIEYGEFDQIVTKAINPNHYLDTYSFSRDYAITSLLRKCENLPATFDKEEIARSAFFSAERSCASYNLSMYNPDYGSLNDRNRSTLLFEVAREIKTILGSCPEVQDLPCNFGPGATSACSGEKVVFPEKLEAELQCTKESVPLLRKFFSANPIYRDALLKNDLCEGPHLPTDRYFKIVNGNKLTFVPKTAKTDRAICIEPHLNIFLQKGIGSYIRERLKFKGLDLTRQAAINAAYARRGSIDGTFATIDLSAASDTISSSLVHSLLDEQWFDLLYSSRSHFTNVGNDCWIENEKFSSMGNGYTFELESLIFYAILRVVKRRSNESGRVMTFGDDIIVPTGIAKETIRALELCGFSINQDKSFISGPFRESCGKDYFLGHNVRPYFFKKRIRYATDIFPVLNGIRHLAVRSCDPELHVRESIYVATGYADPTYRGIWNTFLSAVPKVLRTYGPKELGDLVIYSNRRKDAIQNVGGIEYVTTLRRVNRSCDLHRFNGSTVLCAALAGHGTTIPIRGSSFKTLVGRTPIPYWSRFDAAWLHLT